MTRKPITLILVTLVLLAALPAAAGNSERNFTAHLQGRNEVPEVDTRAQGQAIFHLSKDGTELRYRLIVANIEDVTQAHIHLGPAGVNGPVVVFLFGFVSEGVTVNGTIATGVITSEDLIGSLAGSSLEALLVEIRTANAYVNVHTVDHPAGEVRGQIR